MKDKIESLLKQAMPRLGVSINDEALSHLSGAVADGLAAELASKPATEAPAPKPSKKAAAKAPKPPGSDAASADAPVVDGSDADASDASEGTEE